MGMLWTPYLMPNSLYEIRNIMYDVSEDIIKYLLIIHMFLIFYIIYKNWIKYYWKRISDLPYNYEDFKDLNGFSKPTRPNKWQIWQRVIFWSYPSLFLSLVISDFIFDLIR